MCTRARSGQLDNISRGSIRLLRECLTHDVAKGQRRAERDARSGVVATHDAGRVVADGVQTLDRLPVLREHLAGFVRQQAGKCADLTDDDLDGVVQTLADGAMHGFGVTIESPWKRL